MKVNAELYNKMPSDLQALFERCPNPSRDEVVGLFPVTTSGNSAARFFYCAKSSKADRDEGLDGIAPRKTTFAEGTGLRNNGDGSPRNQEPSNRNHHPTVKPTDLMRYLCRLVTPPRGVVLDPFMGSGSTGKAAVLEGFQFIGIEREPEYIAIARARITDAVCRSKALTFDQQAAWLDGLPNQENAPQKTIKRQLSIFDIEGEQ